MKNIKISVIMPIYNTEEYLEEALDSILNQTMINDIEVLMIDDGSCDNSRYIIEKYALDYDNFFSFHNKNIGQGQERNFGISQARGEYIHFMDSDDYIVPTFYEELYSLAKKEDYDFAMCSISRYTKNSNWRENVYDAVFKDIKESILSTNITKNNSLVYDTCTVNKIIKKSFLEKNQIYFPNKKILYEDLLFSIKLHCDANNIGIINKDLYLWRYRKDFSSVTQQRQNIENFNDRHAIIDSIEKYLKENDIDDEIIVASHLKWLNHDMFLYIKEITEYSTENQRYIIEEINKFLNKISENTLDKLNSDKRILYEIIKEKDINTLLSYFEGDKDLIANPEIINDLDAKYQELASFKNDSLNEELVARYEDIQLEENNDLNIFIETFIPYITNKEKSKIEFGLIESKSTSQYSNLELNESMTGNFTQIYKQELDGNVDNIYKFSIPYEEIKTMDGQYNVLVKYKNEDIEKTCLLTTKQPKKYFITNDVEIFSRFGLYRIFNFNINQKQDSTIKINQINLKKNNERNLIPEYDKEFNIILESDKKIDSLILEHLVTFKQIEYKTNPLSFDGNKHLFEINMPFEEILEFSIRKWELKTKDNIRIQIEEAYKYKDDKIKINIKNQKNRLFILAEYYNKLQEIEKLENNIQNLREKNRELKKKNENLKNTVNEFKSRKVVQLADKLKF